MKDFIAEFKAFAMKGNVIELAVAVVVGGAFGKIVTSFANDIIMPPLGVLMGGVDFSDKALVLKAATDDVAAITLNYGQFINTIVQFLIIAFAIFIVIRQLNRLYKKEEKKADDEPKALPADIILLTEIRDLLQKQKK